MLFSVENNFRITKSCEHYQYSIVHDTIAIDSKESSKLQNTMTPCIGSDIINTWL